MNNCFILLASGQSKRFKFNKPKQYIQYKNKPLYEHSLDKAIESGLFKNIILVSKKKNLNLKKYNGKVKIINGGKERNDSSLLGIKYAKKLRARNVLIHDAARPNFSTKLLINIVKNLKNNKAVVPFISSKDSIKYKIKNQIFNLDKKNSILTQTPQAFRLKELLELARNQKRKISDEATLFINRQKKIKFIKGEIQNNKITFPEDIKVSKRSFLTDQVILKILLLLI